MYMAAGDDIAKTAAAKSRIWRAIIGVFIIFAIGLIFQTLASIVNWTQFFNV